LVAGAVEEPPRATPPANPTLGACYIVDEAATDAWTGKTGCVAGWTSGGWRFIDPADGMRLIVRSTATEAAYRDGSWELGAVRGSALLMGGEQVVGARMPAIASPAGGGVIDAEARAALGAILGAMRAHGLIET
jgi:hypothetical protein